MSQKKKKNGHCNWRIWMMIFTRQQTVLVMMCSYGRWCASEALSQMIEKWMKYPLVDVFTENLFNMYGIS